MARLTVFWLYLLVTSGCGEPCFGPLPHGNAPVGVIIRDGISKEAVQAGIDIWNEAVGTQFVIGLETDYMITIRKMQHPEYYPDYLGLATLYYDIEVRVDITQGYPTNQTIAHELGHLLGLDHVIPTQDFPCNIMNAIHCDGAMLTELDLMEYNSVDDYCEKTTE